MTDLTFDIWQFVRLMVRAEDRAETATDDASSLLIDWRDIWEPLDQELIQLHEEDFAAYSDTMMGQTLTIEETTPSQANMVATILAEVVDELDGLIAKAEDADEKDALAFERSELAALKKKILKQARR